MMETTGDAWIRWELGNWLCIPTNGIVNTRGEAVMGAGIAKQAKARFPILPRLLGERLLAWGNHVFLFEEFRLITFPTKEHWRDRASLDLIRQSCRELMECLADDVVYLPRPGCGMGGLNYKTEVRPILVEELEDNVIVIDR